MTEQDIENAIDRAARDLMDVDTDAAFRARVTARLQRPARRPILRPLAAAALTAAAIAAALVWMRPSPSGAPASTPTAEIRGPGTTARREMAAPAPNRGPALSNTAARRPAGPDRMAAVPIPRGVVVATIADAPASTLPALTAIEPIEIEPIPQTSIAPSEIVVAPLAPISEMQISPLDPQTARD
jgi:hypothetical protein